MSYILLEIFLEKSVGKEARGYQMIELIRLKSHMYQDWKQNSKWPYVILYIFF